MYKQAQSPGRHVKHWEKLGLQPGSLAESLSDMFCLFIFHVFGSGEVSPF